VTSPRPSPSDPLWVITSYYNPAGYRRRLQNFRAFRRHLSAPLLVVELTPEGRGELQDDDADIVMRLSGDDRIWQKERLLNIGASILPPHVRYVAWVDADMLFSDPDWPAKARAVLDQHGGMVQLFDTAYHLPQDIDPLTVDVAQCAVLLPFLSGISIARSVREGQFDRLESEWSKRSTGIETIRDIYNVRGFAWAARREALLASGLYEGMVVGGADWISSFALLGRVEHCLSARPFTEPHKAHIRQWAVNAHKAGLFAHCDDLPQSAWHLWHGTMANRNYGGRYQMLIGNSFDPARDLIREQGRPLRWADPGGALAKAVGEYFFSRREDGE
jgi:hypothetical protein